MADGFSIDVSDLNRLATDLGRVGVEAHEGIRKAVQHSADAVKKTWSEKLYREGSAKLTAGGLSTDITEGVLGVAADIGARRGYKQAGIILLLEVGSVNNPPHGGGSAALDENTADFEARLGLALWAAQKEHGLG